VVDIDFISKTFPIAKTFPHGSVEIFTVKCCGFYFAGGIAKIAGVLARA